MSSKLLLEKLQAVFGCWRLTNGTDMTFLLSSSESSLERFILLLGISAELRPAYTSNTTDLIDDKHKDEIHQCLKSRTFHSLLEACWLISCHRDSFKERRRRTICDPLGFYEGKFCLQNDTDLLAPLMIDIVLASLLMEFLWLVRYGWHLPAASLLQGCAPQFQQ